MRFITSILDLEYSTRIINKVPGFICQYITPINLNVYSFLGLNFQIKGNLSEMVHPHKYI